MMSRFIFTEEAETQILESRPLTIVAVLHGARDVEQFLKRTS